MYVCTSVLALPICCLTVHRLVLFKHFHKCSVLVCGGDGSFGWVLATLDRLDMHDQVRAARSTAPTTQLCPPSLPPSSHPPPLFLLHPLHSSSPITLPHLMAKPSLHFIPPILSFLPSLSPLSLLPPRPPIPPPCSA